MASPDITDITVPMDDQAIQEAFADLDKKLGVHLAAVREVEVRLREMAQLPQADVPQTADDAPVEEAAPQPASHVPSQRVKDVAAPAPVEQTAPAEAPPADAASPAPAVSDDEALLASLDETTSKAIRVMRRLNPNRSVQDLLKQVEKQRDAAQASPKPAAKSWFRRR